ncbi:hypothetical protein AC579_10544 [Pseudocercospora musae]|uniref:Uncharacterized protein n=1 Tax=Pseudocercospora musae TaxID=113226 RepID=A0A139IH95_9PEZI|nr:hypothetical protein AC579_10544 [Pseudocercospora musae]
MTHPDPSSRDTQPRTPVKLVFQESPTSPSIPIPIPIPAEQSITSDGHAAELGFDCLSALLFFFNLTTLARHVGRLPAGLTRLDELRERLLGLRLAEGDALIAAENLFLTLPCRVMVTHEEL